MKKCNKCGIEKELIEFGKNKLSKDGHINSCKECKNKYYSEYYLINKSTICDKNMKYKKENKNKNLLKSKEYYQNNKEKILLMSKEYHQINKVKIRERKRKWYKNNSKSILRKKSKYIKERKKYDKLFHLISCLRTLIKSSFRKQDFEKPITKNIIGCSYEEFKIHIENQFLEEMNWSNYREWHLDHIIPISWAKSRDEVIELNHYSNFKPMWAFDNISKGNKFIG